MDKRELKYFEITLSGLMAYLDERNEEPDDAPDQYRRCVSKAIDTIRKLDFELTKLRAYNNILVNYFRDKSDIVRCKDCVHCFVDGDNVRYNVCELNHNKVQSDEWYCADGKIKPDD